MEKLFKTLIDILNEEVENLRLGHPFNEERISFMKSILSMFLYDRYAILSDMETRKLLQIYEHS